jgi:hypothetical protein
MGTHQIGLQDVRHHSAPPRRWRLLAPLRYLSIKAAEKTAYDFAVPGVFAVCGWIVYTVISPRPPLFGDGALVPFTRDLLIMAVPFMVGALAAVAMGSPGSHLDRRAVGAPILLDGEILTLRQFVCYLLGYLSFVSMVTLGTVVSALLLRVTLLAWTAGAPIIRMLIHGAGSLVLFILLSSLTVTVFWSLYFLTDVVNRTSAAPRSE